MNRFVCVFLRSLNVFLAVGDIDSAQGTLNHCLEMENTYSDAHILMAQIHLYQNNFKLANQSLEVGLSYNFEVNHQSKTFYVLHDVCERYKYMIYSNFS